MAMFFYNHSMIYVKSIPLQGNCLLRLKIVNLMCHRAALHVYKY